MKTIIAYLILFSVTLRSAYTQYSALRDSAVLTYGDFQNAVDSGLCKAVMPYTGNINLHPDSETIPDWFTVEDSQMLKTSNFNALVSKNQNLFYHQVGCYQTRVEKVLAMDRLTNFYFDMGTTSGPAEMVITNDSGYVLNIGAVLYGGTGLPITTSTNNDTVKFNYTYNSSIGSIVQIQYTSYTSPDKFPFNIKMLCDYSTSVDLYFIYASNADGSGNSYGVIEVGAGLASSLTIDGINIRGYTDSKCTVPGNSFLNASAGISPRSSGNFLIPGTANLGNPYYHIDNSVTINGTAYSDGSSFTLNGQTIHVHITSACSSVGPLP